MKGTQSMKSFSFGRTLMALGLVVFLFCPAAQAEHPSDGWIVWASDREDSRHEIYMMQADGSNVTRLTHTGARMPMWSPDGRWIAYETVPAGGTRVMRWDKSEDKEVFNGKPRFWLSDGSRVVCMDTNDDLYQVNPENGQATFWLHRSDFSHLADKGWSPGGLSSDGRWLVTWTDRYRNGYTGTNGQFDAYHSAALLDMNNKNEIYFIGSGCEPTTPPAGDWIYHVCGGGVCATHPDVYRMQISDRASRSSYSPVVAYADPQFGHEYFPRISTDGDWLVYGATTGDPACHPHDECDYEIFIHRLGGDADNRERLTSHTDNDQWPHLYVGSLWADEPPELTSIELTADSSTVLPGESTGITAIPEDQYGNPISSPIDWSVSSGGSMDPASSSAATSHRSLFQSNGSEGDFSVTASSGGIGGSVLIQVTSIALPIRINCGSNSFDVDGWLQDDPFVAGGEDWDNPNSVDVSGVTNAAPQEVYQSVRHSTPHAYSILVPDGTYTLRLHFADAYGDRSMDYFVEGEQILDDFDISTEAGGANLALVKDFPITVTDGDGIQIQAEGTGDVFEAGIEVLTRTVEDPDGGSLPDGDGGSLPDGDGGSSTDGDAAIQEDGAGGDEQLLDAGDPPTDAGQLTDEDEIVMSGGCGCASTQDFPLLTLLLGLALLAHRRLFS
ncbi:MAG: PD40 domain-containing protein [Deltaproteobacteria bacterium]|nr:PD40 domain-containing protein [Deltaproteobacteria bacterium]